MTLEIVVQLDYTNWTATMAASLLAAVLGVLVGDGLIEAGGIGTLGGRGAGKTLSPNVGVGTKWLDCVESR
jgi:hypothetical protein